MMICLTVSVGARRLSHPLALPIRLLRREAQNLLDETLVDAHLVLVPGLGTLTVGGLTGGDVKGLGGKTDGTLDLEGLGASTVDQLRAHLLEGGDLARSEGDTDLVDLL